MSSDDATTVAGVQPSVSTAAGPDLSGTVFDGRLSIKRKIAAGSMGEVYEAEQIQLGRRVAVKVLKPERAHRRVFRERFLREARAASTIDHPNVVDILDVAEAVDGPLYMVMEYVEGLDLRQVLRQEKRLPWWRARPILIQLASAIAAVHREGIIHRDIKPSNCMLLTGDGLDRIKLIDFGVIKYGDAKMESRALTQADDVVGTIVYMSPEQCQGEPATVRTDVYSLGVVAYMMVTGRLPFLGRDIFDIMSAHQRIVPPEPRTLVPNLPQIAQDIILRAIAKNPAERFESMEQLEAALRATPQPVAPGQVAEEVFGEDDVTLVREDVASEASMAETLAVARQIAPVTAPALPPAPPIVTMPVPAVAAPSPLSGSGTAPAVVGPAQTGSTEPYPRASEADLAHLRARRHDSGSGTLIAAVVLVVLAAAAAVWFVSQL